MTTQRKIRLLMDPLLKGLGYIAYVLSPLGLTRRLGEAWALLHTARIRHAFRHTGRGILLYPGLYLRGTQHITIGDLTSIQSGTALTAWDVIPGVTPRLQIGSHCDIGMNCHLSCANRITIEDGVLLGRWVTIVDNSHGHLCDEQAAMSPIDRPIESTGEVTIGRNVWIGDKVTILPNVHIGEGCVIGANSVVTRDIPPYSTAVGCPAKIINQR